MAGDKSLLIIRDVQENSTLVRYGRIARRWKWVIIGAIAAGVAAALIITFLMTRQYSATTRIEIAREEARIVNIQGVQPEAAGTIDQEFYQTQYGLLRSRALAERVAQRAVAGRQSRLPQHARHQRRAGGDRRRAAARQQPRRAPAAGWPVSPACCSTRSRFRRCARRAWSTSPIPTPIRRSPRASPMPGASSSSSRTSSGDSTRPVMRATSSSAACASCGKASINRSGHWSAMPPTSASSTSTRRPANGVSGRAADHRRRPRRLQHRAAEAPQPADPRREPAARRPDERQPQQPDARRVAAAARGGRGRTCPAAEPVRERISRGAGARRPAEPARPHDRRRGGPRRAACAAR